MILYTGKTTEHPFFGNVPRIKVNFDVGGTVGILCQNIKIYKVRLVLS